MPDIQGFLKKIDRFQQRHRLTAIVYGVIKKFGDDQGGNLAALITYFGFISLFPLLLVLFTVLGYILQGHPDWQNSIANSAVANFPILGDQIKNNIGSVRGSGIALAIGILLTLYGGLAVANAAQDAMNRAWAVPMRSRPGFFPRILRSLLLVAMIGAGIIATTLLAAFGAAAGSTFGLAMRFVLIGASLVLNVVLFAVSYRVLTARDLSWGDVMPGAIVAAIGWVILQTVGGAFVSRQLQGMSQTYGMFALVLGLFAWIYLQARVVVYSAELNVVLAYRLYPRSLAPPPLTEADDRAYKQYARTEERRPEERVDVDFREPASQHAR